MDIREEIGRLFPTTARALLGLEGLRTDAHGPVDLTILFTDLDDYTATTEAVGDDRAHSLVRRHNRLVRAALSTHGGVEVKHTGDGIMAYFPSAARAIRSALAIRAAVEESNARHPGEAMAVAMGLNTGAPIVEDGDLYGTAVIVAARLTDLARGGEILVADVTRQLAAGKGLRFRLRGEERLEGLREPVRVYEVLATQGDETATAA